AEEERRRRETEQAVTPVEPAAEQESPAAAWWQAEEPEDAAAPAVDQGEAKEDAPAAAWWSAEQTEDVAASAVDQGEAKEEAPAAAWWSAEEPAGEPVPAVDQVEAKEDAPAAAWWSAEEPGDEPQTPQAGELAAEEATPGDDPWAALDAGTTPWNRMPPAEEVPLAPVSEAEPEDMWGAIAEQTEFAVRAPMAEADDVDLAASLEAQMDEASANRWGGPGGSWQDDGQVPALGSTEDEGDVVLRAFEEHAATPEPDPAEEERRRRETEQALAALFGDEAASIVEAGSEEPEVRPFIRMAAWAPQRSASDDSWAPEDEVRAELERPAAAPVFGFDAPDLVPPWATDEAGGPEEAAAERHEGTRLKSWVRELVETAMLAFLVFLSVRASFQNFKVDGNSMYPTLENGQFLIVNKLVYSEVNLEKLSQFLPFIDAGDDPTRYVFHGPQRGDIVVLRDPRDPSTDLIKRIIGLPGETIEIVNGRVYINDRLLEEPYITAPWNDSLPKILIPPDEYFVMGDNRNNSLDSRSAQVGLVSKDLIIGKATLTYLPLDRFGWAPNQQGQLTDQKPVLTTKRIGEE
ncbi:signal peptidase I, partial [Tepidiforma sp.]|uniref:signal peptidase I n=1 Tax=Tepidiforma sp. TaxID=2682230 RepID=UPI002ADD35B8